MLSKLLSLWKSEGQENIVTPKDVYATFILTYKNLEVGTLTLNEGVWSFRYSEDFKIQEVIKPLVDFPDTEKEYYSNELPPFFAHRIPGLGQPKVLKIIEKEKIDANNEAQMLKRFGKISITNPFHLEMI